jgi:hypothetical protein
LVAGLGFAHRIIAMNMSVAANSEPSRIRFIFSVAFVAIAFEAACPGAAVSNDLIVPTKKSSQLVQEKWNVLSRIGNEVKIFIRCSANLEIVWPACPNTVRARCVIPSFDEGCPWTLRGLRAAFGNLI